MATKKKMLQAAAGNAGGAGPDVEDVFSTYLYTGSGTPQTITNDIDLSGEGGMTWIKSRSNGSLDHVIVDTVRGADNSLKPNSTDASQGSGFYSITAFNNNGFTLDSADGSGGNVNNLNDTFASWTFRKAPKFFDVVTYTGTGDTTTQTISHNLGAVPGCIIVKRTDSADSWRVYHRGVDVNGDSQPWTDMLTLNSTSAASDFPVWGDTAPTSTEFTVGYESSVNGSGGSYVAYLFAHNDGDGDFGPDGDADIIKCGTYTGSGTTNQEINLGFEPQWLLVKNIDGNTGSLDWTLFDNMREWANRTSGDNVALYPNTSAAESGIARCFPTAQGFAFHNDQAYSLNFSGNNYIYIAIRRGTKVPESGTEVFAMDTANGTSPSPPHFNSGFPVDFEFNRDVASAADWYSGSRLTGTKFLRTNTTDAEQSDNSLLFDYQNGFYNASYTFNTAYSWMWKRAPGYFDAVAYTGDGTGVRTVSHNLTVAPDMLWLKRRDGSSPYGDWYVQTTGIAATNYLLLNDTQAQTSSPDAWGSTYAASEVFTVGPDNNVSGFEYIVYLFASLDGISKVGSYTGTGSTAQTIDCGFTSGARFVLIKRSSGASQWYVFDTERGITSTVNDGVLYLNRTNAEQPESSALGASIDGIQPDSSGFKVQYSDINESGATFIFYAIA